jgi:hypothetical protein
VTSKLLWSCIYLPTVLSFFIYMCGCVYSVYICMYTHYTDTHILHIIIYLYICIYYVYNICYIFKGNSLHAILLSFALTPSPQPNGIWALSLYREFLISEKQVGGHAGLRVRLTVFRYLLPHFLAV